MTALIQAPKHQTPSSYTVLRTNMVGNPRPGPATGWAGSGSLLVTTFSNGVPCLQVTHTASTTSYMFSDSAKGTFTPGEQIALSALVEFPDLVAGEKFTVRAHSRTGNVYYANAAYTLTPTAGVQAIGLVFTVPAGGVPANDLDLSIVGAVNAVGYRLRMGQLLIERSATLRTYFDGSTAAPAWDQVYAWTGTANASTSQLRQNIYAVQIPRTTPDLVLGYRTSWATNNIVHDIIGSAEPSYTLRSPGPRSGTLNLFYATESAAWEAAALHRQLDVFEYTDTDRPRHSMRYVVADGDLEIELDDTTRNRWVLPVPYREVIS